MKTYLNGLLALCMFLPGIANAEIQSLYTSESNPEEYCLALNIYHEARSSSLADQAAVSDVVLNRVRDNRYPNTVCGVVKQGKQKPSWKDPNKLVMVRNMCQFSWYCDGKADKPTDQDAWISAQTLAYYMIWDNKYIGITQGATHYHANYVNPKWVKDMTHIGRVGKHIFYKWE